MGAALVSEDWPEERRTMGAALMHTGYYIGFFFAAVANVFIGSHYGWRYMFALGGAPALLIGLIRNNVQEPARWENKLQELGEKWTMHRAFLKLFLPQYRRRTIVNSVYLIVSLWLTPLMTADRLLWAALGSIHAVGIAGAEERRMERVFGGEYRAYRSRVPKWWERRFRTPPIAPVYTPPLLQSDSSGFPELRLGLGGMKGQHRLGCVPGETLSPENSPSTRLSARVLERRTSGDLHRLEES